MMYAWYMGLEARGILPKESCQMNKCLLEATCNISSPFIFRAHATVHLVHLLVLYHNYLNTDNNVVLSCMANTINTAVHSQGRPPAVDIDQLYYSKQENGKWLLQEK